MTEMKRTGPIAGLAMLLVVMLTYVGIQIWLAVRYTQTSAVVLRELREAKEPSIEKTRQEAIALRIENERRTLFWTALSANVSAAIALMLAMFGAWMSFRQFLQTRDRERLDRAATELNAVWQGLTSEQAEVRASSVASLQQFLSFDREEYHGRVVSALALAAHSDDPLVTRTATTVIEHAFRHVSLEVLRGVSWRGIRAPDAKLDGLTLDQLDLRDAVLDGASLIGASLVRCRLARASLKRADLCRADFTGADLSSADLSYAALENATLTGAKLQRARLLRANLRDAGLREAQLPQDEEIRLARHWRSAVIDQNVKTRLRGRFGPPAEPPRVLMLMWEFPPFVTGGAWTAAFHLADELRRLGSDVTIMVPWPQSLVEDQIFGGEVEVIGVGSEELAGEKKREYFYSGYSGYSSPEAKRIRVERDLAGVGAYFAPGPSLMRLVSDFRVAAVEAVRDRELTFDLIHAHDWMALEAAMALTAPGVPLVAHVHSTEYDRQQKPGTRIAMIEKTACSVANAIVVPSAKLAGVVRERYAPSAPIRVIGNSAGDARFVSRGQFGTGRVIFLGRMAWQKGCDLFVDIANRVRDDVPYAEFLMFGDGDRLRETAELIDRTRPLSGWKVSMSQGDYLVEFDRVRQIEFNEETHAITSRGAGELLVREPAMLTREIGGRVCTIVPVQGFKTFTHRFSVYNGSSFLIQTDLLPGYDEVADRFVVLAGNLEWSKRHVAFDEASVVVVPSRAEPFGMVILEAMLNGVPGVCSGEAGALEFVEAAATFDLDDLPAAATAVTRLLLEEATWLDAVERQRKSVDAYVRSLPHAAVQKLWRELAL